MKRIGITALMVVLLLGGCQSLRPNLNKQALVVTPLHGTDITQLDVSVKGEVIELDWATISPAGEFIRIQLPDNNSSYNPTWDSADGFIHLVLPGDGFIDVGISALKGHVGTPAKLTLNPNTKGRTYSSPPLGDANKVDSLVAYQLEDGVRLEWTEINIGDYDFNGEVNLADLTPIAVNFGARPVVGPTPLKEQTVYWVDGDRNGEVNLADITPIAINFRYNVDSYKIYNGLSNAATINHSDAQARNEYAEPLPHFYSVLVDGLATDAWAVAPVDNFDSEGVRSTVSPVVIDEFSAIGSLVISGLNLYQFPSGTPSLQDSGHSLMRIIWPGDDIGSIEIGDIIQGSNGSFALANIPLGTPLELEITYAPVINLLTGVAFDPDPTQNEIKSLGSPVITRFPFKIPMNSRDYAMTPRINLVPKPSLGYNVDITVFTSWDTGTVQYTARLDYFNLRVAAKSVSMSDYRKQPLLRDTNRDVISDAKDQEISDSVEYQVSIHPIRYRGQVTSFDEDTGILEMVDPYDLDLGMSAPTGTYQILFTEYTLFDSTIAPDDFTPIGVLNHEVEISFHEYIDGSGELPVKRWAKTIIRTEL